MAIYDPDNDPNYRSPRRAGGFVSLAVLFAVLLIFAIALWMFYGSLHAKFGAPPSTVPKQSAQNPSR
jgi:hypothetical protein